MIEECVNQLMAMGDRGLILLGSPRKRLLIECPQDCSERQGHLPPGPLPFPRGGGLPQGC